MDNTQSSIEKSFEVLDQLATYPYEYTIADLAKKCNLNRTTVHRLVKILMKNDFVMKDERNKRYYLGVKLYNLGLVYLEKVGYERKVMDILNEIADKTKESVGLAIRDGDKIISLYEIESEQIIKMNYRAGMVYPINRGCYGKCLMAYYNQNEVMKILKKSNFKKIQKNTLVDIDEIVYEYAKIRKNGYVISDEESIELGIGVGVPLYNKNNQVKACLAVSFIKTADYLYKIEEIKKILFEYQKVLENYV